MDECLRLTDENFQREVLDSHIPVFVDFWGSWCPPCKMVEPVVNELAAELGGLVKVGKLNIDRNPATRSMLNVSAAPTFILFDSGKVLARAIGARSKKQLLAMIQDASGTHDKKQAITAVPAGKVAMTKRRDIPDKV